MALSALSSGRCPCDGATLTDPLVFLAKTEQMVAGPEAVIGTPRPMAGNE